MSVQPNSDYFPAADAAHGEKHLLNAQDRVFFASRDSALWEYRVCLISKIWGVCFEQIIHTLLAALHDARYGTRCWPARVDRARIGRVSCS